jgi:ribosomal protein S6
MQNCISEDERQRVAFENLLKLKLRGFRQCKTKMNETTYELGYLLKSDLENKAVLDELSKVNAEIVKNSEPKATKLAYEIEKQSSAQFGYIHFKLSDPTLISELNDALNMQSDVLRFIIIKLPATKAPSKKKVEKEKIEKSSKQFDDLSNEKLEEKLEEFVK